MWVMKGLFGVDGLLEEDIPSELLQLVDVLERHDLTYWLDSGTLLGMVREGRLLESDHDIDISLWWDDAIDVQSLRGEFQRLGYLVGIPYYRGEIYKIWLAPKSSASSPLTRAVDMRFFRPCGEFAWAAQISFKEQEKSKQNRSFQERVRHFAHSTIDRVHRHLLPKLSYDSWLRRPWIEAVGCWWIPAHYFRELERLPNGLPVPAKYEPYLAHRYGEWRVPKPDWEFKTDDPTLKWERPEALRHLHKAGKHS